MCTLFKGHLTRKRPQVGAHKRHTAGNCETADGKLHERQWWGDEPAEPVCTTAVVIIQLWQSLASNQEN